MNDKLLGVKVFWSESTYNIFAIIPCISLLFGNGNKEYLDMKSDNGPDSYMPAHHYFKFEVEVCGIKFEVESVEEY